MIIFRTIFRLVSALIIFSLGIAVGGYLFIHTQPRQFLQISHCTDHCFHSNELAGILTSAGIQQVPGIVPRVILETDKTIAIENPLPQAPFHYVIFPKKDIKNAAELTADDTVYLADAYAVMAQLIKDHGLSKYKILTNGPGYQEITYLHFHLLAPKQDK